MNQHDVAALLMDLPDLENRNVSFSFSEETKSPGGSNVTLALALGDDNDLYVSRKPHDSMDRAVAEQVQPAC